MRFDRTHFMIAFYKPASLKFPQYIIYPFDSFKIRKQELKFKVRKKRYVAEICIKWIWMITLLVL